MIRRTLASALLLGGLGFLACDDEGTPPETGEPPAISGFDPAEAVAGDTAFTLTVAGSGFSAASRVLWADDTLATAFVSEAELTARVPEAAIVDPDTAAIRVADAAAGEMSEAAPYPVIPPPPTTCAAFGTPHAGEIVEPTVWRAAHSPHVLTDTVVVRDTLVLQPGTLVCGGEAAEILVMSREVQGSDRVPGLLSARGTEAAPVVFTAVDESSPWGGIRASVGGGAALVHVRIEDARVGVWAADGWATVDSSTIRRSSDSGARFWHAGGNRLSHSVVQDAAGDGGPAVYMEGGLIEETVVRNSGGNGIELYRYAVTLRGGRIEGNAGDGLVVDLAHPPSIDGDDGPRIVDNAGVPAVLTLEALAALYPSAADQERLLGNGRDTLRVLGYGAGDLAIRADLPWSSVGQSQNGTELHGSLSMEPGSAISGDIAVWGALTAAGTAEAPVTVRDGIFALRGAPGGTSRMEHARLVDAHLTALEQHPLVARAITGTGSSVFLLSSGSALLRSTVDDGGRAGGSLPPFPYDSIPPAVKLAAPGTRLEGTIIRNARYNGVSVEARDVVLDSCEITQSARNGVLLLEAAGVAIHDCNLFGNGGFGVDNRSGTPADARFNWWGDAAGPTGPDGDGVSGAVDASEFRDAPVEVGSGG